MAFDDAEHTALRSIGRIDQEYPPLLLQAPDAPKLLYLKGCRLEHGPCIAVVGTRRPTRYGTDAATRISRDLGSMGVTIVSGMANGIDAAAHEGALSASAKTIAVLGCGPDICYPKRNRALFERLTSSGTVVSEYPPGTLPKQYHFPQRNRIIAAISSAVIVIEGAMNGGAMITARLAAEYGREVFCLPGSVSSPGSSGPHGLIRDGARLVTCADDVIDDLSWSVKPSMTDGQMSLAPGAGPGPILSLDEERVFKVLDHEPALIDRIAKDAGLPVASSVSVLCMLEMKGIAVRYPGGRFCLAG
ncbi:MAG: DNA-processing protein DprA [Actinomycetota bacterium]|nr:DNA-processing protein DprA [Actinomycetota bacterium]